MSNELRTQDTNLFHTGLNKDTDIMFLKEGEYTHAINAFPYSATGEMYCISNESSTLKCVGHPYPIIGSVPLEGNQHCIFSTDDNNSEIGIFNEDDCSYTKIVNSQCLGFKQSNLVKGVARKNFECHRLVYWNDGLNPTRFLNLDDVPYKFTLKQGKNCPEKVFTDKLDCLALLLSPNIICPVISVREQPTGTLRNGSYRLAIAYSIDEIKVTDYLYVSEPQPIFTKQNLGRGIVATITNLDSHFDEYQLILISDINQQTVAEVLGYYSTSQNKITISSAREEARETISFQDLLQVTPTYWRADDMTVVNDTLLQFRVSTKPDLDYQKQANKITTSFVAYKVPQDYYRKGGNKVGYMRDEVYAFFIRWVDKSGKKSSWISIPGRAPEADEIAPYSSQDVYESLLGFSNTLVKKYDIVNTADFVPINNLPLATEGVIGEGKMGYWQSTEKYPDNPVWDDLGCKPIRHHKFPNCNKANLFSNSEASLIILGVKFDRIEHPKDSHGNPLEEYVSFEIARGSRKGNTSIIAKGMVHNAGVYKDPLNSDELTLYRNYPQNDLRVDPFLSAKPVKGGTKNKGYSEFGTFRQDVFTFHSPDSQLRKINLGEELRIEAEYYGDSKGTFQEVYKHPKHKLIRDFSLLVASLVGVGEGLLTLGGQKCTTYEGPKSMHPGQLGVVTSTAATTEVIKHYTDEQVKSIINESLGETGGIFTFDKTNLKVAEQTLEVAPQGHIGPGVTVTLCKTPIHHLPKALQIANSVFLFAYHFGMGTEAALDIVKKIVPFQQYALQYNSHALYNQYNPPIEGQSRRMIESYVYAGQSYSQSLTSKKETFQINNVDRPTTLFLKTATALQLPKIQDTSRILASKVGLNKVSSTKASGYYASIKDPNPAQYGQINSIEVDSTGYVQQGDLTKKYYTTEPIFGGDTYIGRHTEKNIMPFFSQFLYDLRDGFELDYSKYPNIPYPRFWINTEQYDLSEIIKIPPALPNDKHSLDGNTGSGSKGTFVIKDGHFYLSCNGIMDFYCESTLNIDCRGWGDQSFEKHYDPYELTNTNFLFRSDIINRDNYYVYDTSLSRDEQLNFTNGLIQPQDYNPNSDECFTFYRNKVIFSLPQQKDLKKDNWRIFLANNYYDFGTNNGALTCIKPINKTGALFLFDHGSPMMFNGVDTLNTDLGVKVTLGDGGLFAQAPQSITNSDYGLAASSSRWANLNTEFGLFFVSANQGKVFNYSGQLEEISMYGLSTWFKDNLPFKLLRDFPDFPYKDNQVIGCGLSAVFDNTYKLVYFMKKDYSLKPQYKGKVTWDGQFKTEEGFVVSLDSLYFDNASWTISYNPLSKKWVSFHDWHPAWSIQTKRHFVTSKDYFLWIHNSRKDSYCNYYTEDFPFEIEVPVKNQEVTTLSSVEYNLECNTYNQDDYFHMFKWNFDEAILHNSEQITGLLRLNFDDSPANITRYPFYLNDHYEILFSKVEQHYRFNQFWDIIANRGQFTNLQRTMWLSEPNGYKRSINPVAVNYHKPMIQRKPLRHFWNKLVLRRRLCEDKNMVFKWLVTKKIVSLR